jgi:hypothetical protein
VFISTVFIELISSIRRSTIMQKVQHETPLSLLFLYTKVLAEAYVFPDIQFLTFSTWIRNFYGGNKIN